MTTLRARVFHETWSDDDALPWCAEMPTAHDPEMLFGVERVWCPSWPEAMQAAYKMLAVRDRLLMDEVHASRSSRHEAKAAKLAAEERATGRCGGCRDLGPHRFTPDCEFRDQASPEEAYGLLDTPHTDAADIYTLEEAP